MDSQYIGGVDCDLTNEDAKFIYNVWKLVLIYLQSNDKRFGGDIRRIGGYAVDSSCCNLLVWKNLLDDKTENKIYNDNNHIDVFVWGGNIIRFQCKKDGEHKIHYNRINLDYSDLNINIYDLAWSIRNEIIYLYNKYYYYSSTVNFVEEESIPKTIKEEGDYKSAPPKTIRHIINPYKIYNSRPSFMFDIPKELTYNVDSNILNNIETPSKYIDKSLQDILNIKEENLLKFELVKYIIDLGSNIFELNAHDKITFIKLITHLISDDYYNNLICILILEKNDYNIPGNLLLYRNENSILNNFLAKLGDIKKIKPFVYDWPTDLYNIYRDIYEYDREFYKLYKFRRSYNYEYAYNNNDEYYSKLNMIKNRITELKENLDRNINKIINSVKTSLNPPVIKVYKLPSDEIFEPKKLNVLLNRITDTDTETDTKSHHDRPEVQYERLLKRLKT